MYSNCGLVSTYVCSTLFCFGILLLLGLYVGDTLSALLASVHALLLLCSGCCHWLACMLGCFMWPTSALMHMGCWGMVPGWPRRLLCDGSGGVSAGTDPSGAFKRRCTSSD